VSRGLRILRDSAWPLLPVAFITLLLPRPAAADYVVQQGDILEINVLGVPGLHRRTPVDPGGQIALPLIGEIDAAGKSLSDLRSTLRGLLIAKNIVRRGEVVIDVAEYRPVYVGGDVVKPGAYPYRPGMTVRDAVALAEGYDLFRLRGRDPTLEAANSQADFESYAVEIAKHMIRISRLKAELAGRRELDLKDIPGLPVKPEVLEGIKQIEAQRLAADWENRKRDKGHLTQMLNGTKDQLAAMVRERDHSAVALDQQNKYLARGRDLIQRGLLQNSRMEELQRAAIAAQNHLYEMQARVSQAEKDVADFTRKLETLDEEWRVKLLQELQEAITQSETARYRFEAAAEKVRYTAGAPNSWRVPAEPPTITIHRVVNGGEQRRTADETTGLSPGDNVEIVAKATSKQPAVSPIAGAGPGSARK
jgi:polysaccharide export outer membrane protein